MGFISTYRNFLFTIVIDGSQSQAKSSSVNHLFWLNLDVYQCLYYGSISRLQYIKRRKSRNQKTFVCTEIENISNKKLDGVGPIDNRPSTD